MWEIWWVEWRAIHDAQFQSPLSTYTFVTKFLEDLSCLAMSNSREQKDQPKDLPATDVGSRSSASTSVWLPPIDLSAKLNADVGVSRCGRRGAPAVICRDRAVVFMGASTRVFDGLTYPPSLKAQACNEALALAEDLNLTQYVWLRVVLP
ncbi:hypothetical protein D1007_25298 [Hordeum vulgare]|nr:hypothetical protein D1007_25298 [Hordeum vulgare]